MNCPFCKSELTNVGIRRYESLMEHVFEPDEEPSEKPFFKCNCITAASYFWGEDGDLFTEKPYNHDKYIEDRNKYVDMSAYNSFTRECNERHGILL